MTFMEIFMENAVRYADRPMLADSTVPNGLTYAQLDDISGKVYAYLKSKGIGKEDFVMICLRRIFLRRTWKQSKNIHARLRKK